MKYCFGGHDAAHVLARFIERNVLDPGARINGIRLRQPTVDAVWSGIVGRSRKHPVTCIACRHVAQVGGAEANIFIGIGQRVETGVGEFDLPRHFATSGRHKLHQADGTSTGAYITHEQALAPRDAQGPRRRNAG